MPRHERTACRHPFGGDVRRQHHERASLGGSGRRHCAQLPRIRRAGRHAELRIRTIHAEGRMTATDHEVLQLHGTAFGDALRE